MEAREINSGQGNVFELRNEQGEVWKQLVPGKTYFYTTEELGGERARVMFKEIKPSVPSEPKWWAYTNLGNANIPVEGGNFWNGWGSGKTFEEVVAGFVRGKSFFEEDPIEDQVSGKNE